MVNEKPELLSPAGNFEALVAAINGGCDAIYLGGKQFGARANAGNFTNEEIVKGLNLAHTHGVKIYYTMNTLIKEKEINELLEQASFLYTQGIDAFIIQDIGVYRLLKKNFPDCEIHASTQMTVHNLEGVKFLEALGFDRVVVSRELRIDEIEHIGRNTSLDSEGFVHGALCYCYSGQCLMSSIIGGRSGNRGQCAQPCRLPYTTTDTKNKKVGKYLLSPKDIMTLEILPSIIEAPVNSLKIEGRMKSSHYVAYVTAMYRKYIDLYFENRQEYKVDQEDINNMASLYNRGGFSKGFYYKDDNMMSTKKPNHEGIRIGQVQKILPNGKIKIALQETVYNGDRLGVDLGRDENVVIIAKEEAARELIVAMKNKSVKVGNNVYKLKDTNLIKKIQKEIIDKDRKIDINCKFTGKLREPSTIELSHKDYCVTLKGSIVEQSKTSAVDKEKIKKQILKTGNYPVTIHISDIIIDDNIFMPVSGINKMRREAIEKLLELITSQYKREKVEYNYEPIAIKKEKQPIMVNVSIKNYQQFETVIGYDIDCIYLDFILFSDDEVKQIVNICREKGIKLYLKIPSIIKKEKESYLTNRLKAIDKKAVQGALAGTYDTYHLAKKEFDNIRLDYTMNVFNNSAISFYQEEGIDGMTLSQELNRYELKGLNPINGEIVIYGYLLLMTTDHCMNKTINHKCDHSNRSFMLKDRKGSNFKMVTSCNMCVNYLYNSVKTILFDKCEELIAMNYYQFRLDFLDENPETMIDILEIAMKIKTREKITVEDFSNNVNLKDFTRGHFLRGIK